MVSLLLARCWTSSSGVTNLSHGWVPRGMQPGGGDVGRGRIDPDHLRAQPRERLAQQTCAATDIENAQARQATQAPRVAIELAAGGVADIGESQRIDLVQRGHLALGVPP